jgi:hypothetical protein
MQFYVRSKPLKVSNLQAPGTSLRLLGACVTTGQIIQAKPNCSNSRPGSSYLDVFQSILLPRLLTFSCHSLSLMTADNISRGTIKPVLELANCKLGDSFLYVLTFDVHLQEIYYHSPCKRVNESSEHQSCLVKPSTRPVKPLHVS